MQQRLGPFGPADVSLTLGGLAIPGVVWRRCSSGTRALAAVAPGRLAAGIVAVLQPAGRAAILVRLACGGAGRCRRGSCRIGVARRRGRPRGAAARTGRGRSGFALGQARLHAVAAPILAREGVYAVEGRVVDLAPLPSGERLLLDRVTLGEVAPEATPATIRVNLRRAPADLVPGDRVRLRARLQPPLPPPAAGCVRLRPAGLVRRPGCHRLRARAGRASPGERRRAGRSAIAALRAAIARRIAEDQSGARPAPWRRP